MLRLLLPFKFVLILTIFTFGLKFQTFAQREVDERAVINFDEGLGFFDPDSLFGVNIRFRMQNRLGVNTVSHSDFTPDQIEASVRRLRLRFDGFLGSNENFTYYLQLSFSRGDQDWDNSGFPNIIRDAMVFYTFHPDFYMGFGQGKLPGNRQRVVSSGALQFTDRSAVNAIFNIDRDFGAMAYLHKKPGNIEYKVKAAISSGVGRNITTTGKGISYTGRVEFLPLGGFKDDGDFFEGDLLREQTPKLSVGAGTSYNHQAVRTLGQRGAFLDNRGVGSSDRQNIVSGFVDLIAKYNGWAFFAEYASRNIDNQKIYELSEQSVYSYTGWGLNSQFSYVFPSKFELAARYTHISPDNAISQLENQRDIYTVGLTQYFSNHLNKVQLNISYNDAPEHPMGTKRFWNFMIQVETGI